MNLIFYDHLIILENLEPKISELGLEPEEKETLNQIVEETVHFRLITKILDTLPKEDHEEFLEFFHQAPHEEKLLQYLKEKIEDIEEIIKKEIEDLEKTLLLEA
jgi:ribonucleotide reductase beta subunit family protein with ferritin-like domain